jgi:hypothetical protein
MLAPLQDRMPRLLPHALNLARAADEVPFDEGMGIERGNQTLHIIELHLDGYAPGEMDLEWNQFVAGRTFDSVCLDKDEVMRWALLVAGSRSKGEPDEAVWDKMRFFGNAETRLDIHWDRSPQVEADMEIDMTIPVG